MRQIVAVEGDESDQGDLLALRSLSLAKEMIPIVLDFDHGHIVGYAENLERDYNETVAIVSMDLVIDDALAAKDVLLKSYYPSIYLTRIVLESIEDGVRTIRSADLTALSMINRPAWPIQRTKL